MEELTICYEFNFNVAIKRNKGKQQNSYSMLATGTTYSNAVWDMYFTLKKRRCKIIKINSVKVTRIAFVLDEQQNFTSVRLADYPAEIPQDLNKELDRLPQK